jgi:hypothetical protein
MTRIQLKLFHKVAGLINLIALKLTWKKSANNIIFYVYLSVQYWPTGWANPQCHGLSMENSFCIPVTLLISSIVSIQQELDLVCFCDLVVCVTKKVLQNCDCTISTFKFKFQAIAKFGACFTIDVIGYHQQVFLAWTMKIVCMAWLTGCIC